MLIKIALAGSGFLTILVGITALCLMNKVKPENIFAEQKPLWLILATWAYLTFSILGWAGFAENARAVSLLAAGMATLAAVKFLFIFLSYPHFIFIGRALWKDSRALTIVMLSALSVGGLMLFVTRWL